MGSDGLFDTATLAAYNAQLSGLTATEQRLVLTTTSLTAEQRKQVLQYIAATSATKTLTAEQVLACSADEKAVLVKAGLISAEAAQTGATIKLTKEQIENIITSTTLDAKEKATILTKFGVTGANLTEAGSFEILTKAIYKNIAATIKWLFTNPKGWAVLAVGAVLGVAYAISELTVTEEELNQKLEELNSQWNELSTTIKNSAKSFQDLKTSADDIIPKYAKLAQGVDKYGKNVSLTDEEYKEFVSLNNQLGQMFPELVMGYDSNGAAILSLSGDVDTLTESLYACVEAQRLAAAQEIADTMPDVMSNIESTIDGYKDKIDIYKENIEDLKELYKELEDDKTFTITSSGDPNTSSDYKYEQLLNKYGIKYNKVLDHTSGKDEQIKTYTYSVDWNNFETSYNGVIAGIEKKIDDVNNRIESKWKQLNPVVSAWLSTDFLYQDLEKEGQDIVSMLVGEMDFKSLGLKTSKDVQNYISNYIISPIYDMDSESQKAFFEIFDIQDALKNGTISVEEYKVKIEEILSKGNFTDDFKEFFRLAFGDTDSIIENTTKNANKMTVSLSELSSASEALSSLSKAFKELNDDGYITIKTLAEIQTATGLSGDEWDEYERKLLSAKAGSDEFNQVMSDLTYKMLENEFSTIDLSNATDEEVASIEKKIEATLRECGVENAAAVAHEYTAKIKARSEIQNKIAAKGIDSVIESLQDETAWCGLTANAYAQLVAKEIIFNSNELDISGKLTKLQSLYGMLGLVGYKWEYLNNAMSDDPTVKDYARIKAGIYKREGQNRQYEWVYNDVVYSTEAEAFSAYMVDQVTKDIAALTPTSPDYSGNLSDKNKPDYEDPTDAIINRINLRAKELEQQEESIQNAIEIAELENDYKKQISLTNDKLDVQRQKADALKTANDELYQMAEDLRNSTPDWNEEEWFDSQGNATEAYNTLYNNSSKEVQEAIKDQFEKISKIKKAWVENDEERLSLTKEILQTENKIVDLRFEHSQNWIDERNTWNDWRLFNDSEIEAWERVIKWLNEEYPDAIDKIKEAEQSLFEARKKEFDKANDFGNTYLESKKTLLQSYYDVTNSIAEAQHEINKELETSKTMYEYLDEDTRKLLFNQEDYNTLSEKLYDIQYAAQKLQRQYERDLKNSTLETVESITSQYEMQYETLMKSYEIAKADLEIAKKKQKLNNVLNERNVRMFIDGQWQWVANTEDVINAKAELADAEYAKRVEEAGLTQQESINNLTKQQNKLNIVIKLFENGVLDLVSAIALAKNVIGSIPSALSSMYSNSSSSSTSKTYSNKSSGGSSTKSYGGVEYNVETDYMSKIRNASNEAEVVAYNEARNAKIVGEGISEDIFIDMLTNDQAIKEWKKANQHADGTRYTPGGLTLMGEDGFEAYINSNGRLIPINQPTIGNIASGGVVFNTDQMKNLRTLWDMSNLSVGGSQSLLYNTRPQQIDQSQDNRIIINGMTVDSGSSDGQALISALRRYVGNH